MTNIFERIGKVALGSRLRLLTVQIADDASKIYELYGAEGFSPKWFPVFFILSECGEKTITELAYEIGHSQPSVTKIIKEMVKAGLVKNNLKAKDKRKNVVGLTKKGMSLSEQIIKLQGGDIDRAIGGIIAEAKHNLWEAIAEWEILLGQKSLLKRVQEQKKIKESNELRIVNTSLNDWDMIMGLFKKAIELQGKNGYKVWTEIDDVGLKNDIENQVQYKILRDNDVLCIFSVQSSDPFIWQERDKNDAIYLHRIVVNPDFKGQKQFEKVLNWAEQFALQNNSQYVRMDTWADNAKIIAYYQSFGFEVVGNHKTGNELKLPIQNRNLEVALLEKDLNKNNNFFLTI